MNRLHVNLRVRDLDTSVRFYTGLFATEPSVRKEDYAKWMLDDPRVNFSLVAPGSEGSSDGDVRSLGIEHLGIQAETPDALEEVRRRARGLSGEIHEEGETICCYHASDKTWVTDPEGVSWEIFHTSGEADVLRSAPEGAEDCCDTTCCA